VQPEAKQNVQSKVIIPCGHPRHLGYLWSGNRLLHRFDAFPPARGLFPGGHKHPEDRGDVGKDVVPRPGRDLPARGSAMSPRGVSTLSLSASDALHPPAQRGPLPAPRGPLLALIAALAAYALVALVDVCVGVRLHVLAGEEQRAPITSPEALQSWYWLYEAVGRLQTAVYALCVVAFVVWFFLIRRSVERLVPDRVVMGPSWAIVAWFIPLVNFVLPYRIAVGMWSACSPTPHADGRSRTPMWPVRVWWSLFLAANLLSRHAALMLDIAQTYADLQTAVELYIAVDLLFVAAAGAAIHFAVRLTAMQQAEAATAHTTRMPRPGTVG
jgi:hypothetical protein